jgi:hypothetical protein
MAMMVPIPLANGDSMKIYLSKVNKFELVVLFRQNCKTQKQHVNFFINVVNIKEKTDV